MAKSNFIKSIFPLSGTSSTKNIKVDFYDNPGRLARQAILRLKSSNGATEEILVKQSGKEETFSYVGVKNKNITWDTTEVSFTFESNTKQLKVYDTDAVLTGVTCGSSDFIKTNSCWIYTIPGDPGGKLGDQVYSITLKGFPENNNAYNTKTYSCQVCGYTEKEKITITYTQSERNDGGGVRETVEVIPTHLTYESGVK